MTRINRWWRHNSVLTVTIITVVIAGFTPDLLFHDVTFSKHDIAVTSISFLALQAFVVWVGLRRERQHQALLLKMMLNDRVRNKLQVIVANSSPPKPQNGVLDAINEITQVISHLSDGDIKEWEQRYIR